MSTPVATAWKQTLALNYERPLSGPEKFLKCMADGGVPYGQTSQVVTTIVGYRTTQANIVDVFRQAWLHMHNDFPQIAAPLIDDKRVYNFDEVKTKSLETFVVVSDKSIGEILNNLGIIERPWLYVLPTAQKVMIAATHAVTDGRGELYFLHEFFQRVLAITEGKLASTVEWNDEGILDRLTPSLNEITKPAPDEPTIQKARESLQDMGTYQDGIGIHNVGKFPPGDAKFQGVQFSKTETSAIIKAIKQRGATVTPVVHAAISTATNKFAGEVKPNNGIISVDLRPYCGEYAKQPLTMYLGLPIRTVVDTSEFDKTVEAMVTNYKTVRDEFGTGQLAAVNDQFWSFMKESGQPQPPPERSIMDFSNLGVVEEFMKPAYGDLEIVRVSQQGQQSLYMVFLFLLTFRGRMRASIGFNNLYHQEEEIQRFAKLFKSELLSGLGVAQD